MKKLLAVIISIVMIFTAVVPAFAAETPDELVPIIYLRGNGTKIYNADGEEVVCDIGDLKLDTEGEDGTGKIVEAAVNILLPFLTEGLAEDKWDNYGNAIYEELSPLFEQAALDGDGNPQYGTGVHPDTLETELAKANKDLTNNGKCGYYTYGFPYDWRLDPYDHVDALHEYITNVMKATGKSQVALTSRCLGGSVLNAYLEKYGHLGHVKNVLYCDTISNGCTLLSDGFAGKIDFDARSIQMCEGQLGYLEEIGYGVGFDVAGLAGEIVEKSLDLLVQVGVVDGITEGIEALYSRLYKALVPALFKAIGYAYQPIYWTFVKEEDFDTAFELMFGEEGSAEREKYAGLIAKILNYREKITSQHDELLLKFRDEYGIHIGVTAKYGLMAAPIMEGQDKLSDTLASLEDSSFGAICSKIGKTLSEDYIAQRIEAGFGDYISADKQVDASTCLFPETTWIVKNVHHDDFDRCCKALAEKFLQGTNVTVENSGYARFRVNDYSTLTVTDMTEENCDDLSFIKLPVSNPDLVTRIMSVIRLVTVILRLLTEILNSTAV